MQDGVYPSACRMCHGGCGALLHVEGGELTRIEGDPESPFNLGRLCPKGAASLEQVHNPGRLQHPLRRVGARGSGRFEPVSWAEALAAIAEQLDEIRRRQGRALLEPAGGAGLRPASPLRGASREPQEPPRPRRRVPVDPHHGWAHPLLLQLRVPPAAHAQARTAGPTGGAARRNCGRARQPRRGLGGGRDPARCDPAAGEAQRRDRSARGARRARLVVPGRGGSGARGMALERELPDPARAALGSRHGHLLTACAAVPGGASLTLDAGKLPSVLGSSGSSTRSAPRSGAASGGGP